MNISRLAARLKRGISKASAMFRLEMRNLMSRRRVTGETPVVVSLTTYGKRTRQAHLAIESIARGSVLPTRIILWIDDRALLAKPPRALRRLERRGLELRAASDDGPHKKYLPYAISIDEHEMPLVTADDDTIYPAWWLEGLWCGWSNAPDNVHCHRARRLVFEEDGSLAPYLSWPNATSTTPRAGNLAVGGGGVIYPPSMLDELGRRGRSWSRELDRVDDIYLHTVALALGIRVAQLASAAQDFPVLLSSQSMGLWHHNIGGGNNDRAISLAYSADQLTLLRTET